MCNFARAGVLWFEGGKQSENFVDFPVKVHPKNVLMKLEMHAGSQQSTSPNENVHLREMKEHEFGCSFTHSVKAIFEARFKS